MAFCPKTFNQSGSWIGAEPQSEHPYKYVRATKFSCSKYWKEYQKELAASHEQQYHGVTNLPTTAPQTLRFVGNLIHSPSTSVRGSQLASTGPVVTPVRKEEMSFVGTSTHPPHLTWDQLATLLSHKQAPLSGNGSSVGVPFTQNSLTNPTMLQASNHGIVHHAGQPTAVSVQTPAPRHYLHSSPATCQRQDPGLPNVASTCLSSMKNLSPVASTCLSSMKNLSPVASTCLCSMKNLSPTPDGRAALLSQLGPLISVNLSTGAFGGAPTHPQTSCCHCTREDLLTSGCHCTREDLLKMIEPVSKLPSELDQ
ncbi:uncharacterized protein LOC134456415 [Engraulis encrasicolus]|uniref:uncharacterized protein LOC134456415 n=1 Tax=Engraulis encrasicolus TaxID=184585 RepID=UPI002FCEC4CF